MSKVLTYHNQSDGDHWFVHGAYSKREIEAIVDPERGNTAKAPTSIPSPFAQMDLVKTAFNNIKNDAHFQSTRIDFKLISHCLDVGELFFNRDALGERMKIIVWDRERDLHKLLSSSNSRHKRLGEALDLYLNQDADAYNFDYFKRLFFIQIDFKVVGGTSPSTLFFTSSDDLSFVNVKMPNNHVLLGDKYRHLYDRGEEYQLFLYAFRKAMPDFGLRFRELNEYMDKCLKVIGQKNVSLYKQINELTHESYHKLFDVLDTGTPNDMVNILMFPLKKRKQYDGVVDSDFEIRATKHLEGKLPLVLQKGHGGRSTVTGEPMTYYKHPLTKEIAARIPYLDTEDNLEERILPGLTGIQYPHLLLDDFLEPYLIQLVYPINAEKYFDGNLARDKEGRGYLTPIKKKFFDYFSIDDLREGVVEGGLRFFEMEKRAGGAVRVTLRIPVKKDHITFERIYYVNPANPSNPPNPEPLRNKGSIIECRFGATIFPFIKTPDPDIYKHYRVLLVDRDTLPETKSFDYRLDFFKDHSNKEVAVKAVAVRNNKNANYDPTSIHTYVLEEDFDYMQINNGQNVKGLIIPRFIAQGQGNDDFHFTVDFGTTNTHIEYKKGNSGAPKPFEISDKDIQIGTLHDPRIDERYKYLKQKLLTDILDVPVDVFPERLGKGLHSNFPQRTVLAQSIDLDFDKPTYTLADFNIPFVYEKKTIPNYTKIETNLKWSNYTRDNYSKRRVEAFFEKLLFMIRAKVLLNNGKLDKVKMTWFYPSSMMEARVNQLEELWNALYKKYISHKNSPTKLSESIAPFYFYKDAWGVNAAAKPVVAIDIGGGTSDVVIYEKNKPVILTSFKFAANSIFGDGFSEYGRANRNGFVLKYEPRIRSLLESNMQVDLMRVLDKIRADRKSADIVAFFFSLEDNKRIKDAGLPISFSQILKNDDDIRIVFVIFFVALVYHISSLMKAKNLDKPRFITFSGNGSRILQYITPNNAALESLAKIVIEKVYEDRENPLDYTLEIMRELEGPKESTCKGGLMMDDNFSFEEIENIKAAFLGTKEHAFVNGDLKYSQLEENEELLEEVKKEYENFVDLLFEVNKELSFNTKFAAAMPTIPLARKVLLMDIMTHLKEGVHQKQKEIADPNIPIEETMFFYPLIGALNRLAFEIANSENEK